MAAINTIEPVASASRLDIPRYTDLLRKFAPKVIRTKQENRLALKAIEELAGIAKRTPEQNALFDLLTMLIAEFERGAYPAPKLEPRELLQFLLDENDMKPAEIAELMGGRSRVSDVLAGKREISKEQAKKLGERFHLSPAAFI